MSKPLDKLLELLDLEQIELDIFRGRSPDEKVQRVFGGQVAGFISPFVMGYLIDRAKGSFNGAFIFLIIAIVASAVVALTVQQKPTVALAR